MKTQMIMKRDLMGTEIRQNHKTGLFFVNDIHEVGNAVRKAKGLKAKRLGSYFETDASKELTKDLCLELGLSLDEVKVATKGHNGGTWVHPFLFLDMALWYSPSLKIHVYQWVYDGLTTVRDNSGESFKKMNSVLATNFPDDFTAPLSYSRIANIISLACQVGKGKDRWQKASEKQLTLRNEIQKNIAFLADMTSDVGTCISLSVNKALKEVA